MAKQRGDLMNLFKIASQLSKEEQLELISKLSYRLLNRKVAKVKSKTWMGMAGLGREIWRDIDAQEYIKQERISWED